jgi:hypothetical protein
VSVPNGDTHRRARARARARNVPELLWLWRIRRAGASPVSQHPASAPVGESALDRGEPKAGETGTGTFSGTGTGTGTAALAGGLAD